MQIKEGYKDMEIQWYQAFAGANTRILNAHKNTSQFPHYGKVGDYRNMASTLHCTEEETMQKIYGGIETVQQGMTGYGNQLRGAFKKRQTRGLCGPILPRRTHLERQS